MGVPATSDPAQKLRDANRLYEIERRPLPAERLIREAAEVYRQQNDQLGLAEAYRQYGFFFRSEAVGSYAQIYAQEGFLDSTASVETRYEKSVEYFQRAGAIYEELASFDMLSNAELNTGFTYHFMGQPNRACAAFDRSLSAQQRAEQTMAGGGPELPRGFKSFAEYIAAAKQEAGCTS
jgi:tetratricopeptide (TPR) repeat protein